MGLELCQEVYLVEKSWLCPSLFRFAKIAQTDPYKAKALLRTKVYSFPQLQGDVRQLFAGRWRRIWRMATREDLEFPCLQLQNYGARDSWFFARSRPKFFRQSSDHRLGLQQ